MKSMQSRLTMTLISIVGTAMTLAAATARAEPTPGTVEAPSSAYVKPHITHEPYGDIQIVVPLTTDDKGIQGMKLRNVTNGLKAAADWKGKFTVKMVVYAKGVTLLRNPDDATKEKLDKLRSLGVQIEVCGNTLAEQGIDFHTLYNVTEADIVPSGFAEVAYLQAKKRFVVDPIN